MTTKGWLNMKKMVPLTEKSSNRISRVAFRISDEGIIALAGRRRERHVYNADLYNMSITRTLPAEIHTDSVPITELFKLIYLSYLYILRIVNTKDMRRLTTVHRDVITATKDRVFMSDNILKYKIATLRCVIQKLTPDDSIEIEKHFKACDLTADDAILYHMLYHNYDIESFIEIVNTIEDIKFTLDVEALAKEKNNPKIIAMFERTANTFSYRKLRFIADSNRFEPKDIKQDLILRAVQSYYWVRPFYSIDHAINYANRSMHGYTHCIREYYNDESRRRLSEDDGYGHQNTIQSFDEVIMTTTNDYMLNEDAIISYIDHKNRFLEAV